ncbi:MAG: GNAT family N-acetyltransferase [Nanoarchaeota archaeon]|nr:GNAT family N-acetyltransferase [Nanoarchaeota archaeon]
MGIVVSEKHVDKTGKTYIVEKRERVNQITIGEGSLKRIILHARSFIEYDLIEKDTGKAIGVVCFDSATGEAFNLNVDKRYRGLGLGDFLQGALETDAQQSGFKEIWGESAPEALKFHLRRNYAEVGPGLKGRILVKKNLSSNESTDEERDDVSEKEKQDSGTRHLKELEQEGFNEVMDANYSNLAKLLVGLATKTKHIFTNDTLVLYLERSSRSVSLLYEYALKRTGATLPSTRYYIKPLSSGEIDVEQLASHIVSNYQKPRDNTVILFDSFTFGGRTFGKVKKALEIAFPGIKVITVSFCKDRSNVNVDFYMDPITLIDPDEPDSEVGKSLQEYLDRMKPHPITLGLQKGPVYELNVSKQLLPIYLEHIRKGKEAIDKLLLSNNIKPKIDLVGESHPSNTIDIITENANKFFNGEISESLFQKVKMLGTKHLQVAYTIYSVANQKIEKSGMSYDVLFQEFGSDFQGVLENLYAGKISLEQFQEYYTDYESAIQHFSKFDSYLVKIVKDIRDTELLLFRRAKKMYAIDLWDFQRDRVDNNIERENNMAITISEYIEKNPIQHGLVIVGNEHVHRLAERLNKMGFEANVISYVTKEMNEMVTSGTKSSKLESLKSNIQLEPEEKFVSELPLETPDFIEYLKSQFNKHSQNIESLKEDMYNYLLKISPSDENAASICKHIVDQMELRHFINLEAEIYTKTSAVYVNNTQAKIAGQFNEIDLINWLARHRIIDDKIKQYFEQ